MARKNARGRSGVGPSRSRQRLVVAVTVTVLLAGVTLLALVVPGVDVVLVATALTRAVLGLGGAAITVAVPAAGENAAGAGRHQRDGEDRRDASRSHTSLPLRGLRGLVAPACTNCGFNS